MSQSSQIAPTRDLARPDLPRALVTYAADYPAGHRIAWHSHARHQFVHATAGVMTIETEAGHWIVPPGFAVWVPAGMTHALAMHGRVDMRTLYLDPTARGDFPTTCAVHAVPALLRELILRAMTLPALYDIDGAAGRLVAVLLDEIVDSPPTSLHLPWPRDRRAVRVAAALRDNPEDPRTLAAWADTLGAGERTLARIFTRETGLGFRAWRQRLRLLHALRRLAEGAPVTTVAFDCGYASASAFIAAFHATMGASPGRYMANNANSTL
jgi:AraC-like DNA-binding protein